MTQIRQRTSALAFGETRGFPMCALDAARSATSYELRFRGRFIGREFLK